MSLDSLGTTGPRGGTAVSVGALVRISSNTKPMVAALTLLLAEEGLLALDHAVEGFVPELADRRVLRRLDGLPLPDREPTRSSSRQVEQRLTPVYELSQDSQST